MWLTRASALHSNVNWLKSSTWLPWGETSSVCCILSMVKSCAPSLPCTLANLPASCTPGFTAAVGIWSCLGRQVHSWLFLPIWPFEALCHPSIRWFTCILSISRIAGIVDMYKSIALVHHPWRGCTFFLGFFAILSLARTLL